MAIPENYFEKEFKNISYKKTSANNTISIDIDLSGLGRKIDIAQDALDSQVWADIQNYMPRDTSALIQQTNIVNQSVRGEVYFMPPNSDYGHYQWAGIKYVDPVYGVGGFYSEDYGWWSRPGVQKVPSNEPLHYSDPNARAHWDEVAFENHADQWVEVVRRALRQ